jgi:2-C-methyl-D-erythritol 4-phosphate cytidylyltransferase
MHTIKRFSELPFKIHIIVVLPKQEIAYWQELVNEHRFNIEHSICTGGEERFFSVKNGLSMIREDGIVAIHDGVRPLVSHDTIIEAFETAKEKGNAIPCIPAKESARMIENNKNHSIDRNKLRLIQTPQCFKIGLIKKAYQKDYNKLFTDDASVLEAIGEKINLTPGNIENIKITQKTDLVIAEALLNQSN